MATVLDICTRAALNIGALQNGEVLDAQELTVIQAALNNLLDSESIQRNSIYRASKPNRYSLVAGTQDYTFGSIGTLSAVRPDFINSISMVISGSGTTEITVPLQKLDDDDWEAVTFRKYAGPYPSAYHVDYAHPNLTVSFLPVPTVARSIDVYTAEALADTILSTDTFIFPKGYERFIVSNLALEIQPMYAGTVISPQLLKIAEDSREAVRNHNRPEPPRIFSAHQITSERDAFTDIRVRSMWS